MTTRPPIDLQLGRSLVAPSLLSADFGHLSDEVAALEKAGADWMHFDVMDGRFVPNISIGLPILHALRGLTDAPIDVHLMIVEPERWVEPFAEAGADIISIHVEATAHVHRALQLIRQQGCRAGIALNPHTPVASIAHVLDAIDLVLIMTVNPGFGGQRYIESATAKVREVRRLIDAAGVDVKIEVDGGVKVDNIAQSAAAGADVFVSGSGILGTPDYAATIDAMRRIIAD